MNERCSSRSSSITGEGCVAERRKNSARGADGGGEGEDDLRVIPAPVRPLDDAGGEQGDPGGDREHADRVRRRARVGLADLVEPAVGDRRDRQPDRDVDDEDPAPVGLDQQPADRRAERGGDAAAADQAPTAAARFSAGKAARISPSEVGIIIAPPVAWITRAATRAATEGAAAESAEPAVKTSSP